MRPEHYRVELAGLGQRHDALTWIAGLDAFGNRKPRGAGNAGDEGLKLCTLGRALNRWGSGNACRRRVDEQHFEPRAAGAGQRASKRERRSRARRQIDGGQDALNRTDGHEHSSRR